MTGVAEHPYEYDQQVCDLWQMHQLAAELAYKGWETIGVVNVHQSMKVPRDVRQPDGPEYEATNPVAVLIRRPWAATAECQEATLSDGNWLTCDMTGPHDVHKLEHTGLTWKTTAEEKP